MSNHMPARDTTVRHSIVVDAPIQIAFRVFTEQFDRIKPRDHSLLSVEVVETVFERHVGGYLYDRGVDGSECRWARVLAFEPPRRLLISWDINPQWQIETNPENTSEVEVLFASEGETRTRVQLEHRNLERHVGNWRGLQDSVGGSEGWPLYLQRFAAVIRSAG